ncbi:MAG: type I-C CRISPR-associated protein Cas7/Csd2 [Endomicrobium sp.]|uniref:type I-C CRISPR-associated protein Cas7/Csd2 n=1 Tax=Candidatus Endomicrobiellum pyrsonymphae TaxID=1408203 RepID=UPI003580F53B|nr:type I-C CRISPR-associated protein Cas7/Csd2 [Endomicrobium sp.]
MENKTQVLSKKIDFVVIFEVKNANPNGDPLNENIPRIGSDDIGEVTDVCIKRKIRNRLMEAKQPILVQSSDYKAKGDEYFCIKDRLEAKSGETPAKVKDQKTENEKNNYVKKACKDWFDVRAFGQVIAWGDTSIGIRGPVSIRSAFSLDSIEPVSLQITKSVSNEKAGKGSDTMGMKHRIKQAIYVFYGAMNPQLAERTGFSDEDANAIKEIMPKLFENDASSARPEGSMKILKVIWFEHNSSSGQYSSAKVHSSVEIDKNNGNIKNEEALKKGAVESIDGLKAEIIQGW